MCIKQDVIERIIRKNKEEETIIIDQIEIIERQVKSEKAALLDQLSKLKENK